VLDTLQIQTFGNSLANNICPLCGREVASFSDHHLVPRSRGGQSTIPVCEDCHMSIHSFFTNKELESTYNSVDSLLSCEKFAKHIAWLSKQNPNSKFKTKKVKSKKNRGRSG